MIRGLVAAVVAVGVLSACGSGGTVGAAEVGKRAPTFATHDLDGKPVKLTDYRGEVVVLNFWASWCVPCRKEFPLLAAVDAREGVTVLGVIFDDRESDARAFMRERDAAWPGLVDDGRIAKAYGVGRRPGLPMTFGIDAEGVLRARHIGEADAADLDAIIEAAS